MPKFEKQIEDVAQRILEEAENFTQEDYEFAVNFPLSQMVDYALGSLDKKFRLELQSRIDNNFMLRARIENVTDIVTSKKIRSSEQLEHYMKAKGLKI